MNKLSVKQTELAVEEKVSTVDFSDDKQLSMEDIDKLIRQARLAQAEVAGQMVKAVIKSIGNLFEVIQSGLRSATTYDELARLSDRELADIGITRADIPRLAFGDPASRAATADLTVHGYDTKVAQPSNDWDKNIAA
jgi:uncharacterized protein YjiS (DUF1127 family)